MDLPNRDKLERRLRTAIGRVFRPLARGKSRRQPAWARIARKVADAVRSDLDRVRIEAARNLVAKYGDEPLPADFKVPGHGRATELGEDLVDVSRRRWKAMPRRRSDQMIADYYRTNFGPDRIETIAATELSLAQQDGEDAAWAWLQSQGIYLEGYWRTEDDPCEECERMRDRPSKYWRRFYPFGPGSPHPSCRCFIEHKRVRTKKTLRPDA